MKYDAAMDLVNEGGAVARPHWHWVVLRKVEGKRVLIGEEGHHIRYRPTKSDKACFDWHEVSDGPRLGGAPVA